MPPSGRAELMKKGTEVSGFVLQLAPRFVTIRQGRTHEKGRKVLGSLYKSGAHEVFSGANELGSCVLCKLCCLLCALNSTAYKKYSMYVPRTAMVRGHKEYHR